jgi:hypothetical protein
VETAPRIIFISRRGYQPLDTSKRSTLSGDLIVLCAIALVDVLVHVLFSGQYGFHRDEIDVLMNVHQLDCASCPRSDRGLWFC